MNGGYDPEGLMQQYRDWEGQQWQPPTWGQPPPVTVDRNQYPDYYPYSSLQQVPFSAAAHTWGLPSTAAVGGGIPAIGGALAPRVQTSLPMFPSIGEALDRSWQQPPTGIQAAGVTGVQAMERPPYTPGQEQISLMERSSFTPQWESTPEAWQKPPGFLEQVIGETGPFTPEAREYFQQIKMQIKEPGQLGGGGGWMPWANTLALETSQPEGMIHELSHAWWEEQRQDRDLRQAFVEAVIQYADESQQDETKSPLGQLAHVYIYGDPNDPDFSEGMKTSAQGSMGYTDTESFSINGSYWYDWEIYAGLASGSQGDIRQFPPYLQQFYEGLFNVLPPEAPGYAFPESRGQGESIPALAAGPGTAEWGYRDLWPEERIWADQMRRESMIRKQP